MKRLIFISACVLLRAAAAEPEFSELYRAGEGGYAIYRIPGIAVTANGTVLNVCEARKTGSDWAEADILLRRSTDGGRTWSQPAKHFGLGSQSANPLRLEFREKIGAALTNVHTYHNCVLIPERAGAVHVVFCLDYWRVFHSKSTDDGVSWSSPREITDAAAEYRTKDWDWRVVGNGTGHGIQLETGRLLTTIWLARPIPGRDAHRPSQVGVLFSDDAGSTWRAGDWVAKHSEQLRTPSEACLVQLSDGGVLCNIRHEGTNYLKAVSYSKNGVIGWTAPQFDPELFEPICQASMVAITNAAGGRSILFCNPDSRAQISQSGRSQPRRNLTIRVSDDDGRSWRLRRVLDNGLAAYSDLAQLKDGTVLCLFERGEMKSGKPVQYTSLTLARIPLSWLEAVGD